jgi:hypothetical protein
MPDCADQLVNTDGTGAGKGLLRAMESECRTSIQRRVPDSNVDPQNEFIDRDDSVAVAIP